MLHSNVLPGDNSPLSVRAALALVRGYQLVVRPLLSGQCRYLPTCSEYAAEAIATYGARRGGWMAFMRVMRCHPLGGSGLDPVPCAPGLSPRHSQQGPQAHQAPQGEPQL